MNEDEPIFIGYDSDLESLADDESLTGIREDSESAAVDLDDGDEDPPTKRIRRRLEEPVLVTRSKLREKRINEQKQALRDIEKTLTVTKNQSPSWRQRSAVISSTNDPVLFANGGKKWSWGS